MKNDRISVIILPPFYLICRLSVNASTPPLRHSQNCFPSIFYFTTPTIVYSPFLLPEEFCPVLSHVYIFGYCIEFHYQNNTILHHSCIIFLIKQKESAHILFYCPPILSIFCSTILSLIAAFLCFVTAKGHLW